MGRGRLLNSIALRAFLGFSGGELAPKLVLMATGDRVVARVTGALAMGAVGTWLAWASRAGAFAMASVASLAVTAAWLAVTAGRPHWQAAMLANRATIAVIALWLAANVEKPRMAYIVALGMVMMIVEVALAYAPLPVVAPDATTTIAAKMGPAAPSVVPAVLLSLVIWAAWGEIMAKARSALAFIVAVCRGRPDRR